MKRDIKAAIDSLKQAFGEQLTMSDALREQHGHTTTWLPNQMPDAVLFARSEKDIIEAVKICAQYQCPVIAFGTGSSLEGQLNAPEGGISIDVSQMNKVLEVNTEDLDCTVQPGVTRKQLNEHLRDTGLFFPIDPGADASIGGMVATRASGTNAVRYGTMRENTLALNVITADGRLIKTATRARKSSAGYDMTRLFVGSEGTLGILSSITLRLQGIPESITAGYCSFPTLDDAVQTVIQTIQCGLPVARIELMDELQVKACNAYSNLSLDIAPTLFLEFHGTEASTTEQAELFGALAQDNGSDNFTWAARAEDRSKLWQARHDSYWAGLALRPGAKGVATDVCVPISMLAECISETKRDIDKCGMIAPIVGHVGDGNFHVLPLIDMDSEAEKAVAKGFLERLVHRAIAMGGTSTGEHGIGQGKMGYLRDELGESVDYMQLLKQAFDPHNIMNPGKIFELS